MENKGLCLYHCGGGPRAGRCHCAHLLASIHPAVSSPSVSVMSVPADDFSVQTVVWGPAHAWPPILKQQWFIKALVLKLCICILDNEKQRIKSAQTQHCNESLPHKVYSLKFVLFCFLHVDSTTYINLLDHSTYWLCTSLPVVYITYYTQPVLSS